MKTSTLKPVVLLIVFFILSTTVHSYAIGPKYPMKHKSSKSSPMKKCTYIGLGVGYSLSSSMYGVENEVNFIVKHRRSQIEVGGLFKEYEEMTGAQLRYKYIFNPKCCNMHVYLTANMMYHPNSELSATANNLIYFRENESFADRYKTIEEYAGVGFTIRTRIHLDFDASVGFGAYQSQILTVDNRPYDYDIHRPDNEVGVAGKVGLIFRF